MAYSIGILGATGAVGQEIIRLLHERGFPMRSLRLLASARSAGKELTYGDHRWIVEEATDEAFADLDCAIFSAGASQSLRFAAPAVARGCVVIDNSSAFRSDENVPLVVPEINPDAALLHEGIIANPNCSTAIALMALYPLHQAFGLRRVIAATYQAVSGSGAEAMRELDQQVRAWAKGEEGEIHVYPHRISFNLIPQVDAFLDNGYTKEEMKMQNEGRKIMGLRELKISCTCVRVPVFRAHSIALNAAFERPVDVAAAREAIASFPGCELVDEPSASRYPMPKDYSEVVACGVGRIRIDTALDNGLALWVVGDQLWKGAALNAIQIAELLHQRGALSLRGQQSA
jgi:aspartate-semialdehyde dehydrogenase